MLNKKELTQLIDKSEETFNQCWEILCSIKNVKDIEPNKKYIRDIIDFQNILAKELFVLETKYNEIAREKDRIIINKAKYNPNWFKLRLKHLSSYQMIIVKVINIGRTLGDAYAWFFYQNERQYLNEHLKHENITHMTTGVGGLGELHFLQNIKVFENHITLYHGITNILRLGDFSFIDIRNFEVDAIGEIKTDKIDDDNLNIQLELLGPKKKKQIRLINSNFENKGEIKLPPVMKDRLQRQIKRIEESFSAMFKKPSVNKSIKTISPISELNKVKFKDLVSSQQIGKSMLCIIIKNPAKRLSKRIINTTNVEQHISKFGIIIPDVLKIMDRNSKDNSIMMGTIHYSSELIPHCLYGTVPTFWWPLNLQLLKGIYFLNIFIVTVYNPIHIEKQIKELGFNIEWDKSHKKCRIVHKTEKYQAEIVNFEYFFQLIYNHLFTEDAVFEMIRSSMDEVLKGGSNQNIRIELDIFQQV